MYEFLRELDLTQVVFVLWYPNSRSPRRTRGNNKETIVVH